MNHEALSRMISYALRHAPDEFDIMLDQKGWTSIEALLRGLHKKPGFENVSQEDIEAMLAEANKQRHEVQAGRIRACYGHSTSQRIEQTLTQPPDSLYHGTSHRALDSILREGLTPQKRQYVHLSKNMETAYGVGFRRDTAPVLLRIKAGEAWADGVAFYLGNNQVWLADNIPPKYLEVI